ncbi:S8 family serine peptidase [Cellulomonas sp. Marseille-Q8402]
MASLLLAGTAAVVAGPAAAQPAGDIDEGLWYHSQTGLEQLHEQARGAGITIALIDSQINPAAPDLVGVDLQVHEPSYCVDAPGGPVVPAAATTPNAEHTTNMASLLVGTGAGAAGQTGVRGIAPGAALHVYTVTGSTSGTCEATADGVRVDDALLDALDDGADIVVVPGSRAIREDAVARALRAGTILVAAGGNDGIVTGYPALSNGVVATGTVDETITLGEGSPRGDELGVVAPGAHIRAVRGTWDGYGMSTGSSNSAAFTAGALALAWSLHPEATGNQVVQALIHTTDGRTSTQPAHDDEWGYGTVNVRQLLSVDPSAYPDENPFLYDAADRLPTVADVLGSASSTAPAPDVEQEEEAAAEAAPVAEDAVPDAGAPVGLVVGIAAAVLVLTAVVVAASAARRRRSESSPRTTVP